MKNKNALQHKNDYTNLQIITILIRMFAVKQIVWAKVKNYPWWPAQINKLPTAEHNYFKVTFIGETNHALLEEKAVRKYQDHYEHLKTNTYKGLQNSIELANNELQKRKAFIEESQNKLKNQKVPQKGKKIKKNNKSHKKKLKCKQKITKNCKSARNSLENQCEQKEKVQIKKETQDCGQKPALIQDAQQKSEIGSLDLQDSEGQSGSFYEIDYMRSVDRKKIENGEEVLFSHITRFNSNLYDKERECFDAIQKIEADDFKPEELIQSKITNMITYLCKKLTERNGSTLKKQELEKIHKIKDQLRDKAFNYLVCCEYYDQFIKRIQKNNSLKNIEKVEPNNSEPRLAIKKHRKYKRKIYMNKKTQPN